MTALAIPADWATRISAAWRRSAESIIETGRLLSEAKAALSHGEWGDTIAQLPFDERTTQRLIAIAGDARLSNPAILPLLPDRWTKLHALHRLDDEALDRRLHGSDDKADRRAARERELAEKITALPTKKYGVVLADAEWRFEPWSRQTGMDRAADNHYPTSTTEVIASRDVASIAADDCVLFLWATVPMLPQALLVMGAWGFDYKSHFMWAKDRIGTGYWNRNKHELLLLGTRGKIPAPAMGAQWESIIDASVAGHSQKPERFLELIEAYFPTLPKIELNRRGPRRLGWDTWGNESDSAAPPREGSTVTAPLDQPPLPSREPAPRSFHPVPDLVIPPFLRRTP